MLAALVIRLRQDRGNRDVACVRRQHRVAARGGSGQRCAGVSTVTGADERASFSAAKR